MIRRRNIRRAVGIALVVAGGVLMWLAPDARVGLTLLVAGIVLEIAGIALEHRDGN